MWVLLLLAATASVCALVLIASLPGRSDLAQGQTVPCPPTGTAGSGGIFSDTTWSASLSPYIVTGTVTLFHGYTLTIEPGVEVRFVAGTSLTVRGTLMAAGTQANHIVFTSNDCAPSKGSWGGI